MAAQSTAEKLERIEKAWGSDREAKLIYEWVKTGNLSLSEFKQALELVSQLNEDESRKLFG